MRSLTGQRKRLSAAVAICMIGALGVAGAAIASDVDITSVVDTSTSQNNVELAPGQHANVTINWSVTGRQVNVAKFEVYRDWELQDNGTFDGSNPQEITVQPREAQDPATTGEISGTVSVPSGSTAGAGPHTLTVGADVTQTSSPAALAEGHTATFNVTVLQPTACDYTGSSIRQPINASGSSVFKRGSTVPVKVSVVCDGAAAPGLAPRLSFSYSGTGTTGAINEDVFSSGMANTGDLMREEDTPGNYIHNLSTKGRDAGTYRITVRDDDGNVILEHAQAAPVQFGLR